MKKTVSFILALIMLFSCAFAEKILGVELHGITVTIDGDEYPLTPVIRIQIGSGGRCVAVSIEDENKAYLDMTSITTDEGFLMNFPNSNACVFADIDFLSERYEEEGLDIDDMMKQLNDDTEALSSALTAEQAADISFRAAAPYFGVDPAVFDENGGVYDVTLKVSLRELIQKSEEIIKAEEDAFGVPSGYISGLTDMLVELLADDTDDPAESGIADITIDIRAARNAEGFTFESSAANDDMSWSTFSTKYADGRETARVEIHADITGESLLTLTVYEDGEEIGHTVGDTVENTVEGHLDVIVVKDKRYSGSISVEYTGDDMSFGLSFLIDRLEEEIIDTDTTGYTVIDFREMEEKGLNIMSTLVLATIGSNFMSLEYEPSVEKLLTRIEDELMKQLEIYMPTGDISFGKIGMDDRFIKDTDSDDGTGSVPREKRAENGAQRRMEPGKDTSKSDDLREHAEGGAQRRMKSGMSES